MTIIGIVVPYLVFIPWLEQHGLDFPLFIEMAWANRISQFFVLDVVISAVVVVIASRDLAWTKRILVLVATLGIGVSAGLPLWLALRDE
jgi:hypothetical protein